MDSTLDGREMLSRLFIDENANASIFRTPSGTVTSTRFEQPQNAYSPMLRIPSLSVKDESPEQLENAPLLIALTLPGTDTLKIPEHA